jgi:acetyltransferase
MLDEFEAKALLKAYGIPTIATLAVGASSGAAAAAAREIGYPVALKILSHDISHKTDVGGVCLNLRNDGELERDAGEMLARVRAARPDARISGFTVQAMASRPFAQELIVGASIDPVFGPVLMFGQGGTAVEVIADRAVALPPLNRVLAKELISRTQVRRLLAGYRDHPPAKIDAICDVLVALSQMLADLPELAELDINPLWADAEGALALDARVRVGAKPVSGASRFAITPYPIELEETATWLGQPLQLRPIRPEDEPQHRAFAEQLDPEDLRLRFFSCRHGLPRSELARLTQIDYEREMAFVAVRTRPDGAPETVGEARGLIDPDNIEAELGLMVRSDLKGHGLGSLLLGKLIAFLTQHGTQRLVALVLHENQAMRELARRHGFVTDSLHAEPGMLRLVRQLTPAKT